MMPDAAGKFTDLSTPDRFRFAFHCERCGALARSETYLFNTEGFACPLDQSARALLWARQHKAAYARASAEAKYAFNTCPACGRRVCGECFHMEADAVAGICVDCARGVRRSFRSR